MIKFYRNLMLLMIPMLVILAMAPTMLSVKLAAGFVYGPNIRIGILNPNYLPEGGGPYSPGSGGTYDGASMAAKEINNAGGVVINSTTHENITLDFQDEGAYSPSPPFYSTATTDTSMSEILGSSPPTPNDQFIIGGFRTETTEEAESDLKVWNTAGNAPVPMIICGSATTAEINGTDTTDGLQWVFRATPVNDNYLFGTIAAYIQQSLAPELAAMYTNATYPTYLPGDISSLPYARKTLIPPSMYPLAPYDVNLDGKVDIKDVHAVATCYGTYAGGPGYVLNYDVNTDGKIDIKDVHTVAAHYGQRAPQWPLPGSGEETGQVRFAVICESYTWTAAIEYALTTPSVYPYFLGTKLTTSGVTGSPNPGEILVDPLSEDFVSLVSTLKSEDVHLIIDAFTMPEVNALVHQMAVQNMQAMLVGIDVPGQQQSHWADTGGTPTTAAQCNYEVNLLWSGTDTPIINQPGAPGETGNSTAFWNDFLTFTAGESWNSGKGCWPMYTAAGAYDAVYQVAAAIEWAGTTDTTVKDPVSHDSLLREGLECVGNPGAPSAFYAPGLSGEFMYEPITNAFGVVETTNDVFSMDTGLNWTQFGPTNYGFARSFVVQWVQNTAVPPAPFPDVGAQMNVLSPVFLVNGDYVSEGYGVYLSSRVVPGVGLTFDYVNAPGWAVIKTTTDVPENLANAVGPYYNIFFVNATFSGNVTVSLANEPANMTMAQYYNGTWNDLPTWYNGTTINGITTHFSFIGIHS